MGYDTPAPPPPLDPVKVPGTEEWARAQLHAMPPDDARAVTDIVAWYMAQHWVPGLGEARVYYARVCHERHWHAHMARQVWAILEALLRSREDDIPF